MPQAILANCDACGTLLKHDANGDWPSILKKDCPGRATHQPANRSIRNKEW